MHEEDYYPVSKELLLDKIIKLSKLTNNPILEADDLTINTNDVYCLWSYLCGIIDGLSVRN